MMNRRQAHFPLARVWLGIAMLAPVVFCLLLGEARAQSTGADVAYLKAGIKSLAAGKSDLAVKQFSQAIASGKLSEKEVAKALFERGQAYRKSGKHALAIADLTNALYLKTLTGKDKDVAHLERARAFTALGMTSRSSADIQAASRAATPGNQAATAAPKTPAQAVAFRGTTATVETGTVAPTPPTVAASQPTHTVAVVHTPKEPTLTSDPVGSISNFFQSFIPGSDNKLSAKPQIQQTASIAKSPPAAQNKPVWQTKASVAQTQKPASAPTSTASATQTARNRPVWMAPDAAPSNQASSAGWSGSTQISASPVRTASLAPRPVKALAANVPPPIRKSTPPKAPVVVGKVMPSRRPTAQTLTPPPVAKAAPAKRFHLQLAAVSSQAEANQVWQQLSTQHANLLSGLTPTIKKKTETGKGTYYHVGLGPFSTKSSTGRICDSFKQQGLNCSVVKH